MTTAPGPTSADGERFRYAFIDLAEQSLAGDELVSWVLASGYGARFLEQMQASGLAPGDFVIELTESAWSVDSAEMLQVIAELRAFGTIGVAGACNARVPASRPPERGVRGSGARRRGISPASLPPPMAVPKQKQSHARTAQRRAQHKIATATYNACPQCHSPRRPHRVCPVCGTYRGREVIAETGEQSG